MININITDIKIGQMVYSNLTHRGKGGQVPIDSEYTIVEIEADRILIDYKGMKQWKTNEQFLTDFKLSK